MPCLSIAGACAIPRTMASLLIVTQVECPLPRIPAKKTTGWPLWCESRLSFRFRRFCCVFHILLTCRRILPLHRA
ncbi:hypothetical protein B0H13DRAFT_1951322 [Mycena leptocephala]|nr:hypothetical protein B0H13DRAFT_1951322 [Mycena leptocephala]